MYSFLVDHSEYKKTKLVNKNVVAVNKNVVATISYNEYKDLLLNA